MYANPLTTDVSVGLQVHLSHNEIGLAGAEAILRAIPAPPLLQGPADRDSRPGRPAQPRQRPLWLRLEWNCIPGAPFGAALAREREARGLQTEVPAKQTDDSRGHEQNLIFSGTSPHLSSLLPSTLLFL